jgi:hypothetical protein
MKYEADYNLEDNRYEHRLLILCLKYVIEK